MKHYRFMIASPDGALSFLFGVLALILWYTSVNAVNPDMLVPICITQLVLSLGSLACSLLNILRGKPRGNLNLITTILLGLFPGFNTLITLLSYLYGQVYSPKIYGLMYIVGSVFAFGVMFGRLHKAVYRSLGTGCMGVAQLLHGLSDMTGNVACLHIAGWFFLLFALSQFWFGMAEMWRYYGAHWPEGVTWDQVRERLHA